MKHLLLSTLLTVTAAVASAGIIPAKFSTEKLADRPMRRVPAITTENILRPVRPVRAASPRAEQEAGAETAFYESFEAWPADDLPSQWLPDGWTAQRQAPLDDLYSWFPMFQYSSSYPAPAEGQYYYMILASDEEQDEWLITPQIEIAQGVELSYYLFYQPIWLFSDANLNTETYKYEGEKIIAATFQVMVKAEGDEEWTKIQDIADRYKDYDDAMELIMATPTGMQKQNVDLSAYYGKKVQFGFRYIGKDGDSMWFDAVRVGIPGLDDVSYSLPAHTLYWGMTPDFISMTEEIAQLPVMEPVTFTNTSGEDATYSWKYIDPVTGEEATGNDQIDLQLTYYPDYTDETTLTNNIQTPPTLIASAPGKATTEYTPSISMQAGGTAEFTEKGVHYRFSLFPFTSGDADLGGITVSDDKIGALSIPVFGHNQFTNEYWYNYTAGNDEDASPETCYNHLEGIANLYMPEQGSKLVVNGINVFGFGLIQPEAELKFSIYALKQLYDEDNTPIGISADPSDFVTVATQTIKGSEIIYSEGDASQKDYICLPFAFDAPVVITATEKQPAFFFMLEGFNSDKVEYFMPLQTRNEKPGVMNLSYMMSHIDFQVASGRPAYYSVKPLLYTEDDDVYSLMSAFAFGVIADFPWLTCETKEVTIGADQNEAKVMLGSYYDGSQLTVEAPEGFNASVAGRYDRCELTIERASSVTGNVEGTVTVKGPGVEISVNVKADAISSIADRRATQTATTEAYDLFGRRSINPANGVYVIKNSDGSVTKSIVK